MTDWAMQLISSENQLQYFWWEASPKGFRYHPAEPPIAHQGDNLTIYTRQDDLLNDELSLSGNSPVGDFGPTLGNQSFSGITYSSFTLETTGTFIFNVILGNLEVDPQMIVEPPIDGSIEPDKQPVDIEALVKRLREDSKRS